MYYPRTYVGSIPNTTARGRWGGRRPRNSNDDYPNNDKRPARHGGRESFGRLEVSLAVALAWCWCWCDQRKKTINTTTDVVPPVPVSRSLLDEHDQQDGIHGNGNGNGRCGGKMHPPHRDPANLVLSSPLRAGY